MNSSLMEISIQLNRWILLIVMFLGVFGNTVNIAVFIRPVFNHHVCSWYFFVLAVNNCIYSLIVIMYHLLTDGFQIQAIMYSFPLCQFVSYITVFCTSLSHYITVLAAIDRYCAGSTNVRRRKFNSFQVMPWSILVITIFSAVFAISSAIITDLKPTDEFGCSIQITTIYNQFYLSIQFILFVIVAPILTIIFALLAIRNRRLVGDRPMAVSKCRHMEHHLTDMLLLLAAVHLVFHLTEWIEYLILLRPDLFKSRVFIETLILIPIYVVHILPIICHLITSKEYRRELRKIMPILAPLHRHSQVDVATNKITEDHLHAEVK